MIFRRCLIILSGLAVVALTAVTTPAFAAAAAPVAAAPVAAAPVAAAPVAAAPVAAAPVAAAPVAAGPAASVVVTVTPPTSASTRPASSAPMDVVINGVHNHCFTPGIIYSVNTTGIHVRALPDGASNGSIGKGRWFDSEVFINGVGPYHCVTSATIGGQYWVLGAANYNANLYGYVGLNYLNFVQYVN